MFFFHYELFMTLLSIKEMVTPLIRHVNLVLKGGETT